MLSLASISVNVRKSVVVVDDSTDDEDRVDVKLVQAHDTAANTREVDAKDPLKVKGNADDDDEERFAWQ